MTEFYIRKPIGIGFQLAQPRCLEIAGPTQTAATAVGEYFPDMALVRRVERRFPATSRRPANAKSKANLRKPAAAPAATKEPTRWPMVEAQSPAAQAPVAASSPAPAPPLPFRNREIDAGAWEEHIIWDERPSRCAPMAARVWVGGWVLATGPQQSC